MMIGATGSIGLAAIAPKATCRIDRSRNHRWAYTSDINFRAFRRARGPPRGSTSKKTSVCYDTRQARPAASWRVEEVRRFLHRRRPGQCASGPYAGEPADQPHHDTSSTYSSRHHARKRTQRRSAVHARVRVTRLRVVVKVSHLLAAAGPCTRRRCMRVPSSFQLFEVYYVFGGARARARSVQGAPTLSRV